MGRGGIRACYVTPDLTYDCEGERKRRGEILLINGMRKKKKEKEKKSEKFPWVGVRTQAYFNHFVEPFNVKNRPLTEGLQAVATAASLGTTTIVVYSNRR